MEVFDKDGNPIEGVFSKEELEAQIAEAVAKAAPAKADNKKDDDDDQDQGDEMPQWAKDLASKVDSLAGHQTKTYLGKVVAGLDTDKQKEVEAKYNNLTGYEDTPEGLARRSEDAYLLATGEKYNAGTVNMANLMAAGGGKVNTDTKVTTEADKAIQSTLGITAADVEKYGKK